MKIWLQPIMLKKLHDKRFYVSYGIVFRRNAGSAFAEPAHFMPLSYRWFHIPVVQTLLSAQVLKNSIPA